MDRSEAQDLIPFSLGIVLGAAVGAGVALLLAPQSGRKTRKLISRNAEHLRDRASDRWDELADEVRDRVDDALTSARQRLS
jgi:gas vesicle protein